MNKDKKTIILLTVIIVFLVLGIIAILIINPSKKSNDEKTVYGIIKDINSSYILVETDNETIKYNISDNDELLEKGDFVIVDSTNSNVDKIDVIAKKDEYEEPITIKTSNAVNTTTTKTTQTIQNDVSKDEKVLAYVSTYAEEIPNSKGDNLKKYIKDKFITIIDFIFYDKDINGITWKEITNKTKAKVIYYTLKIDNKIETIWPEYKETISTKYKDIKAKLVATYLDITTKICDSNKTDCALVKQNFNELKTSLKISWTFIKECFKYAYDKSTTYLKNWYEVFRG